MPEVQEEQEKREDLLVSITIEGELLDKNREKILYLSSKDGILKGQVSLSNNQKNSLTIEREPNEKYFAIIHDKITLNGRTRHDFAIFENIETSNFALRANNQDREDLPKVDIYLENTGNLNPIAMTGRGSSSGSGANGGNFESHGTCISNPGDYYALFKKQDETFARHFWTEDLVASR